MAKAIKITIDDIKEIVMESVTEIQNYQRNVQNAQNVFLKGKSGYNGITHFGVITAENPDSMQVARSDNKSYQSMLSKDLKSGHYIWV